MPYSEKTFLENRYNNKLRISMQKNLGKNSFATNIDFTELSFTDNRSVGYSISQNANIELHKKAFVYVFASYFHTDDSNSSIYVNERNIPGVFNSSSFYGEGVRFSSTIKAKLTPKVIANFKFALTSYFNRNTISSGLRMINSSYQTDLNLNIKYNF